MELTENQQMQEKMPISIKINFEKEKKEQMMNTN
jgi:hypothetical protein